MKVKVIYFLLILVSIISISCKTNFEVQVYRFQPSIDSNIYNENEIREKIAESDVKSIILRNDSILEYSKHYGGLASYTAVKYKIVNNDLITDSINLKGYDIPDITDIHFLYSRDSLVNKQTNDTYYNQKYLKRISRPFGYADK